MADHNALKKRCLAGDDSAWRELYKGAYSCALYVALKPPFRFDDATAADIAQETVVELATKLVDVDNWLAFTGRVAHNKCVDRVRKKKETPLASFARDDAQEALIIENLLAPEYLPESMDDNRALGFLRTAVQNMGQPCRTLLQARFFDELSYDATAARSSVPPKQVGVYITRCLSRLRIAIQNEPRMWDELKTLLQG